MSILPPCAGIIVIDIQNNKTILVCTEYDNYSFPKGKRNKGETIIDAAWRELGEETGLRKENVDILSDYNIDENSDRGNVATRYFVGKLIKENEEITFDQTELKKAEWLSIDEVYKLEKFKERRKDILKNSINKLLHK